MRDSGARGEMSFWDAERSSSMRVQSATVGGRTHASSVVERHGSAFHILSNVYLLYNMNRRLFLIDSQYAGMVVESQRGS